MSLIVARGKRFRPGNLHPMLIVFRDKRHEPGLLKLFNGSVLLLV